jgi:hypothetical protein
MGKKVDLPDLEDGRSVPLVPEHDFLLLGQIHRKTFGHKTTTITEQLISILDIRDVQRSGGVELGVDISCRKEQPNTFCSC